MVDHVAQYHCYMPELVEMINSDQASVKNVMQ
jgi:hypothetical protein